MTKMRIRFLYVPTRRSNMVLKFCTLLFVLFASSCFASESETVRNENIILPINEAHEVALPEGASIHISRKGIVDVQVLNSKLRIVGIKNGLVVLTLTRRENSEEDLKYFITVESKEEDLPKNIEDLKKLCEGTGLIFTEKTRGL